MLWLPLPLAGEGWGEGMDVGRRHLRPDTPSVSFARARTMRRVATPAEIALWRAVRHRSLAGLKLRRQVPCGRWILDFAALGHCLAIELDGETHATDAGAARDAARNAWLVAHGWRVLRFTNREVLQNLEGVLTTIAQAARALGPHPGPLP